MSTNNNKKNGNHFEEEFCELLALHGFWAHNMAQNQVGQPADVIAVKNGIPVLIDCKECETNRFPLSRIEGKEAMSLVMFEINVYSNKSEGKKTECKSIAKAIDEKMFSMNFRRLAFTPVPNLEDATIYRIIARYSAATDGENFYRR